MAEDAAVYQRASAQDAEFRSMLATWAGYVAHFTASIGAAIE